MWALLFRLRSLVRDERGQDMVEYALLLGALVAAAGAIVPGIAEEMSEIISKITDVLQQGGEA